nr:MAG TPA: tail collar fiber protein [Caudoviricetes sp.]
MANYIGWILTNKGRELLAKAINNETKINITKFKIGAGYSTGNDRELTDLLDKRNEFPVNSYERKENGIVEFTFIVSNKTGTGESTITNSFKISEMGIYAQDDSGTEILYAYNKGTDGDYIPVYNGKNAIDIVEKCIIIIDQAATLNVTIDNSITYLTRESADRRYLEIQGLAKIIGLEYGGNIQDTGAKVTGKFYYDKALKYYYECIVNNNLTYNDGSKFRAISNKPILDKVENLFKYGNNWMKLPFGLIIQWGVETIPNGDNVVTLPTSYRDSNSYQIVVSDTGGGAHRIGTTPISGKQFRAYGRNPSNEFARTGVRWLTIGY